MFARLKSINISPETHNELMLVMQQKPTKAKQIANNNVENEHVNNNEIKVQNERFKQIERQLNMIQQNLSIFSIVGFKFFTYFLNSC
jgi:hypothetical protein